MEIDGRFGHLTDEEKSVTGLPSHVLLSEIDPIDLLAKLAERQQMLDSMRAADDDELTHSERASIPSEMFRLADDRRVTETLAGQLMAHEVEISLGKPKQ